MEKDWKEDERTPAVKEAARKEGDRSADGRKEADCERDRRERTAVDGERHGREQAAVLEQADGSKEAADREQADREESGREQATDGEEKEKAAAEACEKKEHSKYAIGLRTIKTALAVLICLLLHKLLTTETALFSCIAAVVCMRATPGESWQMGLHRFYGTLIGGAMGFLLMELAVRLPYYQDWLYVAVIPIGLIACIWLCLMIDKKNGVIICCVVFISIGLDFTMDAGGTLHLVILRVVDTTVGIVVAGLLNRYFFPKEVQHAE